MNVCEGMVMIMMMIIPVAQEFFQPLDEAARIREREGQ
jgi:hypothetical protein